jgi:hypothetical protein
MTFRLRSDRAHETIRHGLAYRHLHFPDVGLCRRPDARIQLPDSLKAKSFACPSASDGAAAAIWKKSMNPQIAKFLRLLISRSRRIRA